MNLNLFLRDKSVQTVSHIKYLKELISQIHLRDFWVIPSVFRYLVIQLCKLGLVFQFVTFLVFRTKAMILSLNFQ